MEVNKIKKETIKELLKTSLIVCNKHSGVLSHQVTNQIKNMFNVKRAGHAGTLVWL